MKNLLQTDILSFSNRIERFKISIWKTELQNFRFVAQRNDDEVCGRVDL